MWISHDASKTAQLTQTYVNKMTPRVQLAWVESHVLNLRANLFQECHRKHFAGPTEGGISAARLCVHKLLFICIAPSGYPLRIGDGQSFRKKRILIKQREGTVYTSSKTNTLISNGNRAMRSSVVSSYFVRMFGAQTHVIDGRCDFLNTVEEEVEEEVISQVSTFEWIDSK